MQKKLCPEQIAKALVENAINDGFLISVTGTQMVVDRLRNFAEITKAMFSTDMDTLTLNVEKRRVGIITLAYGNGGNGSSVISDHTDVPCACTATTPPALVSALPMRSNRRLRE